MIGSPRDPAAVGNWVEIADRQCAVTIRDDDVRSVVLLTLDAEQRRGGVEVALVDDATIAELHQRFLGVEGPTDVLSFPLADESGFGPAGAAPSLGEVVVSTDTARRQAPGFLGDPLAETLLYVIHGVLHLIGYDDSDDAGRRRMEVRQSEILARWRAGKGT